ncbi:lipopolysaccharide heptosyltransferase II [Pandoraea thiooxydans]|uniref:lipopolysaccharide heptosyltransferase II n=1 Tax=Pandoraea thiooxydans TaxID=445709 RepID=A0A0G3EZL4_9BURK|nr:lipopolysaccharide heptosyltransferase II [Pandoraea thiooxydans]AKJ70201.1 lipopolysaccharide heptosyltransferase II [Pandoraea thiooxydans]
MRKALVIAPNWIGDALMAQPLFVLLKRLHPRLQIDAIAPGWVAPILERMPEVDRVVATDLAHGKLQPIARWQLAGALADEGYDAAYVLPNSFKSALIPWLARVPLRIGYTGEQRYGLLNVRHANPPKTERPPMVRHYAALAFAPGASLPADLPTPRIDSDLNESARVYQRFGLDLRVPLVVFCPGAEYGPAKRWPSGHFAALAQLVRRSFPYTQIIALGSAKDGALAQEIAAAAPFVQNLCGQTSLSEACAILGRANAVVSNDSGLMHVTAALRRPQIALFGSSDPRHTPPLSSAAHVLWLHLDCSPCFARECPLGHLRCLNELTPEHAFANLRNLLLTQR